MLHITEYLLYAGFKPPSSFCYHDVSDAEKEPGVRVEVFAEHHQGITPAGQARRGQLPCYSIRADSPPTKPAKSSTTDGGIATNYPKCPKDQQCTHKPGRNFSVDGWSSWQIPRSMNRQSFLKRFRLQRAELIVGSFPFPGLLLPIARPRLLPLSTPAAIPTSAPGSFQ